LHLGVDIWSEIVHDQIVRSRTKREIMKKIVAQFGKTGAWFSGDAALMSDVWNDGGLKKSNNWVRVKSARTEEEFLENVSLVFPGNSIIFCEKFI